MHFGELIGRMPEDGGRFRIDPSEDWRQGRTLGPALTCRHPEGGTGRDDEDLAPARGQLLLNGQPLARLPLPCLARQRAMLPQRAGIDPFAKGGSLGLFRDGGGG
jgi:hypothetical protein